MNNINYEVIKDSVVFGFEEYIEEGYNSSQAAARILEEDCMIIRQMYFHLPNIFLFN
ncbi:MAG: hypothetical protein U0K86_02055 [Agathobacter sp.]|nr:hypothetical protein [Agathobacter sp.]